MTNQNKTKKNSRKRKRQEHEKKPIQKGIKSMRGQGEIYDETKKSTSFGITPTAYAGLKQRSSDLNISTSELIEQIGRGLFRITQVNPKVE